MKEKVEDMTKLEGGGEGGIRETKKECMYRTCDVHDQEANGYHISLKKKKKKKWKRSQDVSVGIMQKGNVFCKWIENSQTPELPKVKFSTLRMTRRWLSL